ncbi:MAG: hypothetical protein J6Y01_03895, partial [Spirochaetales bacterium]|nr:hypothetical protein [Spirochaetales bacterium]
MKRNIIYYITSILTTICLFGCADPTPKPEPAPAPHVPTPSQIANTVTFSGSVYTDSGRSAIVDLSKLNLVWSVTALKLPGDSAIVDEKPV